MTFTTNQMQDARYTTRQNTLDTIGVQLDCASDCLVNAINAPADGLSISEATEIGNAIHSRLKSLSNVQNYVHTLRKFE